MEIRVRRGPFYRLGVHVYEIVENLKIHMENNPDKESCIIRAFSEKKVGDDTPMMRSYFFGNLYPKTVTGTTLLVRSIQADIEENDAIIVVQDAKQNQCGILCLVDDEDEEDVEMDIENYMLHATVAGINATGDAFLPVSFSLTILVDRGIIAVVENVLVQNPEYEVRVIGLVGTPWHDLLIQKMTMDVLCEKKIFLDH